MIKDISDPMKQLLQKLQVIKELFTIITMVILSENSAAVGILHSECMQSTLKHTFSDPYYDFLKDQFYEAILDLCTRCESIIDDKFSPLSFFIQFFVDDLFPSLIKSDKDSFYVLKIISELLKNPTVVHKLNDPQQVLKILIEQITSENHLDENPSVENKKLG